MIGQFLRQGELARTFNKTAAKLFRPRFAPKGLRGPFF